MSVLDRHCAAQTLLNYKTIYDIVSQDCKGIYIDIHILHMYIYIYGYIYIDM